jgi:hypothetical protein
MPVVAEKPPPAVLPVLLASSSGSWHRRCHGGAVESSSGSGLTIPAPIGLVVVLLALAAVAVSRHWQSLVDAHRLLTYTVMDSASAQRWRVRASWRVAWRVHGRVVGSPPWRYVQALCGTRRSVEQT